MVRQAQALGIKSKLISEDAVYHPKFLEVGGKATEGVYLTFANPPKSQERKAFENKYKAMWKADKIGSYGYYAYDAAMTILGGIKKAGTTDTAKVANAIRNNEWRGVSGKIKFDKKGDRKLAHILWIVKNGAFVRYWDPLTGKYF